MPRCTAGTLSRRLAPRLRVGAPSETRARPAGSPAGLRARLVTWGSASADRSFIRAGHRLFRIAFTSGCGGTPSARLRSQRMVPDPSGYGRQPRLPDSLDSSRTSSEVREHAATGFGSRLHASARLRPAQAHCVGPGFGRGGHRPGTEALATGRAHRSALVERSRHGERVAKARGKRPQ
jgi:hypothetical protein